MYRSGAYLVQEFVFYFIKINKNRRIITQVHSHLPHSTKPPPSPLFLSKPSLPRKSATFTVTRVSRTFCGWYIIPQGIWSKAEPTTTIYWVNNILLLHGERCYRDRQTVLTGIWWHCSLITGYKQRPSLPSTFFYTQLSEYYFARSVGVHFHSIPLAKQNSRESAIVFCVWEQKQLLVSYPLCTYVYSRSIMKYNCTINAQVWEVALSALLAVAPQSI